jgi:hypothetical protein
MNTKRLIKILRLFAIVLVVIALVEYFHTSQINPGAPFSTIKEKVIGDNDLIITSVAVTILILLVQMTSYAIRKPKRVIGK